MKYLYFFLLLILPFSPLLSQSEVVKNKTDSIIDKFKSGNQTEECIINLYQLLSGTKLNSKDSIYINLAVCFIYSASNEDNRSTDLLLKSKVRAYEIKDTTLIIKVLTANVRHDAALKNVNGAKKTLDEIENLLFLFKNESSQLDYYEASSVYYLQNENYSISLKYMLKILEFQKKTNGKRIPMAYNNVGVAYYYLRDFKTAIAYLDSSNTFAIKLHDDYCLWYSYYTQVSCYEYLGDFENASATYKKYLSINDSMIYRDKNASLAKMEAKYKLKEKQAEIKELELDKKQKEKEKNQFILVTIIVSVGLIIAGYLSFRTYKNNILLYKQKKEIESKTEEISKQSAQIARLQTQMNPHFVFNALGAIQQFVVENNLEKTLNSLNDFSHLMRLTLNNSDKESISLKQEIDFLNLYLKFEQLRFNNEFEFNFKIEEAIDTETTQISPMLIQPILENAIQHGIRSLQTKGIINVNIKLEKHNLTDVLLISLIDNGVGYNASKKIKENNKTGFEHESKAINICKKRIEKIWEVQKGEIENTFAINSPYYVNENSGTEVLIKLPLIENF